MALKCTFDFFRASTLRFTRENEATSSGATPSAEAMAARERLSAWEPSAGAGEAAGVAGAE